jgi:hypothetical protein
VQTTFRNLAQQPENKPTTNGKTMTKDNDFKTYQINALWHWEGLGVFEDYCSEDGFESEQDCIKDAEQYLTLIDAFEESVPC